MVQSASANLRHTARLLHGVASVSASVRARIAPPVHLAVCCPHYPRTSITCPAAALLHTSSSSASSSSSSSSLPTPPSEHGSPSNFTTVNQAEISHFDALASTWWDPHGPSRLLHLMNPLRHDFIRDCHQISSSSSSTGAVTSEDGASTTERDKGLRYLDIGCGGGIFAESAARLPTVSSVTALDASASVLSVARAHLRQEIPEVQRKLTYLHSSVEAFSDRVLSPSSSPPPNSTNTPQKQEDPRFDVVTTFEVIEHVENQSAFLERCGALVRPGGWLVLSTIARTWLSWATTVVAAEEVLGIVPRGTHDWHKYVDTSELSGWFARRPASEGWRRGAAGAGPGDVVMRCMGVVYVPGLGWREVAGSEKYGNYFFGVRKSPDAA